MNKKTKRNHFNKLDEKSKEKDFWKFVKPLLNSNCKSSEKRILLVEDDTVVSDEKDVVPILNSYFNDITSSLDIQPWDPGETFWEDNPIYK